MDIRRHEEEERKQDAANEGRHPGLNKLGKE